MVSFIDLMILQIPFFTMKKWVEKIPFRCCTQSERVITQEVLYFFCQYENPMTRWRSSDNVNSEIFQDKTCYVHVYFLFSLIY